MQNKKSGYLSEVAFALYSIAPRKPRISVRG